MRYDRKAIATTARKFAHPHSIKCGLRTRRAVKLVSKQSVSSVNWRIITQDRGKTRITKNKRTRKEDCAKGQALIYKGELNSIRKNFVWIFNSVFPETAHLISRERFGARKGYIRGFFLFHFIFFSRKKTRIFIARH